MRRARSTCASVMAPACTSAATGTLIVDVGFNVGQDSAAYLEMGHYVLAVEANPLLHEWATHTSPFKQAIAAGRLELLNRAIVGHNDTTALVPFYISKESEANRIGSCFKSPCTVRAVPTITCASLLQRAISKGLPPLYLKSDVEGYDTACLRSIIAAAADSSGHGLSCLPRYMSFEDNVAAHQPTLMRLVAAGYRHFKYIDQLPSYGTEGPISAKHGYHGAGSGPFGEFAFDRVTRYGWRSVEAVVAANQRVPGRKHLLAGHLKKGHLQGDLHVKLNNSWLFDADAMQQMLLSWQRPVTWPLSAA